VREYIYVCMCVYTFPYTYIRVYIYTYVYLYINLFIHKNWNICDRYFTFLVCQKFKTSHGRVPGLGDAV